MSTVVQRNSGDLLNLHRDVAKQWRFTKSPPRCSETVAIYRSSGDLLNLHRDEAKQWRFTRFPT